MIIPIDIYSVDSSSLGDKNESFVTSLDIIQEVMNVPMNALASLLKANGYHSNEDTSSFCIDERQLDVFANAYVRKMRSYFFSSLHNISKLDFRELKDYIDFVESFKKKGVVKGASYRWSDIDEELIKETFKDAVKRKTPVQVGFSYLDLVCKVLFSGNTKTSICENGIDISKYLQRGFSGLYNLRHYILIDSFCHTFISAYSLLKKEEALLASIVRSCYYIAKSTFVKTKKYIVNLMGKIMRFARYYIFSSNADDNHNSIMISVLNVLYFNIFNRDCCERLCIQTTVLNISSNEEK